MSVTLSGTISRYIGLSTDTKPLSPPAGSTFLEEDTGNRFVYDGESWVRVGVEVGRGSITVARCYDETNEDLLIRVLEQLEKMNIHLEALSGEKI